MSTGSFLPSPGVPRGFIHSERSDMKWNYLGQIKQESMRTSDAFALPPRPQIHSD